MPLNLKTKFFQQGGDDFCGAAAISRRIVGRNLDDLGKESRLSLGVLPHKFVDRALDWRHAIPPIIEHQASTPSMRIPS